MKFKGTYIFLLLLTQALFAQVAFKTKVSKNKLGVNQRLRVEFTITNKERTILALQTLKLLRFLVALVNRSINLGSMGNPAIHRPIAISYPPFARETYASLEQP